VLHTGRLQGCRRKKFYNFDTWSGKENKRICFIKIEKLYQCFFNPIDGRYFSGIIRTSVWPMQLDIFEKKTWGHIHNTLFSS
jgi:hypothetical protein